MNLNWLEDVLILLEEGNMTRAAQRRNITQPAFSRRIQSFEDWLGTPVLDRRSNRVELSAALLNNEADIAALSARLRDLRGKIANFDPARTTVSIAAQHAPVISTFSDIALEARSQFPGLTFRLRPANLRDCVAMFVRGDVAVLLCYEVADTQRLPFGGSVRRIVWGSDMLVPVVGGALRFRVGEDGQVPLDTPAIIYPEDSFFGNVLAKAEKSFATRAYTANPVCETAFSNGIKEMIQSGLGIGWVPISMCYKEIERGDMVSLSGTFGHVDLQVALYSDLENKNAGPLIEFWDRRT